MPALLERVADELDEEDFQKSDDTVQKRKTYLNLGRPYLVYAGIDNGSIISL